MNKGLRRAAALTIALFSCGTALACADPVQATFALTVNPLNGHHQINGGTRDNLVFAPLPLGELTLRRGGDSLRIEGLPPVSFHYNSAGDGAQSTQLSILNGTYRHSFAGGWFVGAGQTIYNQYTTYRAVAGGFYYQRGPIIEPIYGSEAQFSRVVGARFEAGRTMAFGANHVEIWAAANPRMRGIQYTRIPQQSGIVSTFPDPENGSQVDLSVRVAHPTGKHGEFLYGLRYLNYTAHYDDFPGELADVNVGFAPVVGYRVRF
ncbi:MAG: hypothetical protein JO225_00420 [Candidatus Eremiobacteraeota bacterium]|nr:hypothetical protein [Candidatus Eremiobacteraeota bacterium]